MTKCGLVWVYGFHGDFCAIQKLLAVIFPNQHSDIYPKRLIWNLSRDPIFILGDPTWGLDHKVGKACVILWWCKFYSNDPWGQEAVPGPILLSQTRAEACHSAWRTRPFRIKNCTKLGPHLNADKPVKNWQKWAPPTWELSVILTDKLSRWLHRRRKWRLPFVTFPGERKLRVG